MNNQEKILSEEQITAITNIANNYIYLDNIDFGKLSHDGVIEIIKTYEHFRPKLTVPQVKTVFEQLYSGQISFSKATQILNGDE